MKLPVLALLVLTALVRASAAEPAPIDLRVVSFNMLGGDGTGGTAAAPGGRAPSGQNAWATRRDAVASLLRDQKPDLISLQKAGRLSLDDLHKALPGFGEVGAGRDDGKTGGEYAAILFRTDRFKLDASGTFWLSETPDVAGSVSWGPRQPRVCSWARLVDQATGAAFYIYNTHLDPTAATARENSAALILARIRDRTHPDPFILTGDMNSGETSPTIAKYKAELVDTFRAKHPDDTDVGTRHQFTGQRTGDKVDYILVPRSAEILTAEILRAQVNGQYPSDHFPVSATLRLK